MAKKAKKAKSEKRKRSRKRSAEKERRRQKRRAIMRKVLRVLGLILLGVLLAVPAIFVNNIIGYLPVFVYVLLIIVSRVYLAIAKRSIRFEEVGIAGSCIRGQSLNFTVRLQNKSILPLLRVEPVFFVSDLFGNEASSSRAAVSLAPREDFDFNFDVTFDHIGTYSAGLKEITVTDLIGLFSTTYTNEKHSIIEVVPRVFNVEELKFDLELLRERPEAASPISLDGADYTGVREYVIGDPMKSIHWKLSARGDVYYTKLFETLGRPGVEAILDFHSPEYDADDLMSVFDAVVESALSVGAYAQKHGMDFDLVYRDKYGMDRRVGSNSQQSRLEFVDTLPAVSCTDYTGVAVELLQNEASSLYAQPNVVLCTATVDELAIRALIDAKQHRMNPMLIAVVPPSLDPDERKDALRQVRRLDSMNISYMSISSADDLVKAGEEAWA